MLTASGCAHRVTPGAKPMAQINNGLMVILSSVPAPPRAGDNVFSVAVSDAATKQPVVDANVTVNTSNQLTGLPDRQTGRSQGDGTYQVPVRFGIPDTYRMDVVVQRTGKPDALAHFTVEAQQGG